MGNTKRDYLPALAILLIAPIMGELLSGSSPPAEYFQPVTLIMLTLLYGVGALVIRETVRRWNKGWLAILLLGFAYGIFEEGIMVRSFFDPAWGDLGFLAIYGRWAGVNWIWAIALTIFHAWISIFTPIMLTELSFPQYRTSNWLPERAYQIAIALFFSNALMGPLFGMQITIPGFFLSVVAIMLLAVLAKRSGQETCPPTRQAPAHGGKIILLGTLIMIALVIGMWVLPGTPLPAFVTFSFLFSLPWAAVVALQKLGIDHWGDIQIWSFCFGLTIPWLILSFLSEFDNANRPDDTSGMIAVVVIFTLFLFILRVRVSKRDEATINQAE